MKKMSIILLAMFLLPGLKGQSITYPAAKKEKETFDYHGVKIVDHYTWMADLEDRKLKEWMNRQDDLTKKFVRRSAQWKKINQTIIKLGKTGDSYSPPTKVGGRYFYLKSSSDYNHSKIFAKQGLEEAPQLVLDPNEYFPAKEVVLSGYSYSPDGRYAAFFMSNGPASWGYLRLFDLKNKKLLDDKISGVSSGQALWTEDGKGFYYSTYGNTADLLARKAEPKASVKYHRLGTAAEKDRLIFPRQPKTLTTFAISESKDKTHVVVEIRSGRSDQNDLVLINTEHPLTRKNKHLLRYIGNAGADYFFYTNKGAKNGKVVALRADRPAEQDWKEIIGEKEQILAGGSTAGGNAMNMIGDKLVLLYRFGTHQYLKVYNTNGKLLHNIELETGWIGSGIVGQPDDDMAWFSLNTFLDPSTVYGLNLESGELSPFIKRDLPIRQTDYVTRNTYYYSEDGTKVPIYIAHKKGLKMNGQNPVYMYAYGFGGWVAVPWYQPHMLTWLEMGGIYVLPGVRGGGEFGDAWKEAGIRLNRQNAIDDYISAAEFLVAEGYSAPGKLVANGWSASGSLAAAAVMQRPGLFGAAMIGIPSLDLLRYQEYTPFKGWTGGYGSPEVREEFQALYQWSPYHNIKENTCYPPMMVTVGELDPTTPPQHGYKFVAAMQEHQAQCEQPVLLKIVWGGGHGFGTDQEQRAETYADELSFLTKVLNLKTEKKLDNE